MGIAAVACYSLCSMVFHMGGKIGMLLSMMIAIIVAVCVYVVTVIKARCITYGDMKMIPGGERIGRLLRMK